MAINIPHSPTKLVSAFRFISRVSRSILPVLAPLIVFLSMIIVSWRRWVSPIADSGREMDLPLRLLGGETLYRDVHYLYPPLSPYFNALLYRIFGAHLDVLMASGIVCSAIIAALCYRIARRILTENEAAVATIAVIVWCVFRPAGNLAWPYAFAALHGMIFALGVLLLSLRYAEKSKLSELIFAGILIGLAAITKQEFALASAVTVTATLVYLNRSNIRGLVKELACAAIPAALIALPVYALLITLIGWRTLVEECHLFYTHLPQSLVFYNSQRTGLDRPLFSVTQVVGGAAVATVAMSVIVLISDRSRKLLRWSLIMLFTSSLIILAVKLSAGREWDGGPLRALPLLLAALIVIEWRRGRESGSAALFIVSIYSLAVLARVSLRVPSGGAFGGFFLPTSLIIFCYLFMRSLPDAMQRWTADVFSAKRARMLGFGLMVAMFLITAVVFGIRYRRNFNYEITAERGRLFAPRVTGPVIDEALRFIERETSPGETIAVLPEGSDLAFLTGRRIGMRHQILIPGLMSERDEREAIDGLAGVRFVFIINRPMREFGKEAFGRDFYQPLGQWIEDHYRVYKVFGGSGDEDLQIGQDGFFIKTLIRKEERETR